MLITHYVNFLLQQSKLVPDGQLPPLPGVSAYQRIISNNSYAHDEERVNPGQEKQGSTNE